MRPSKSANERRYVINPCLIITKSRREVCIENPNHAIILRARPPIIALLDFFARPRTLTELSRKIPTADEVMSLLLDNFILFAEEEASYLAAGFLRAAERPVGQACVWSALGTRRHPRTIAIFGAPSDAGATNEAGAREGPLWIRRALDQYGFGNKELGTTVLDFDLRRCFDLSQLSILDFGDIQFSSDESPHTGGARIGKLVRRFLSEEMVPVMLGGDHSLTWFALREVLARHEQVGVLHFDAHSDLYSTRFDFGSTLNHANVFAFARREPSLALLRQIGLRGLERPARGLTAIHDPRIQFITAQDLQARGSDAAFEGLQSDIPYYLSFDVDCVDPAIAPETGTTRAGGLALVEAVQLIDRAARELHIIAADFMEVGAAQRPGRHDAADVSARCVAAFLFAPLPSTALAGHLYGPAERRD